MQTRYLIPVFLAAALAAQPAAAATVYDEITLDQLQQALSKSFDVKRAKSNSGKELLLVQGRENLIGVTVTHCGNDVTCEGVEFWAIVDRKHSAAQMNDFNLTYSYSKMVSASDGDIALRLEMYTAGGVTDENLSSNAAILMVRQDKANESNSVGLPANPQAALAAADYQPSHALRMKAVASQMRPDANVAARLVKLFEAGWAAQGFRR